MNESEASEALRNWTGPHWTARNDTRYNDLVKAANLPHSAPEGPRIIRYANRAAYVLGEHARRSAGVLDPHCEEPKDTGNIPATVIMRDGSRWNVKTNGKMPHDAVGYILNGRVE